MRCRQRCRIPQRAQLRSHATMVHRSLRSPTRHTFSMARWSVHQVDISVTKPSVRSNGAAQLRQSYSIAAMSWSGLNGLTFYEDETDPTSWLRDVRRWKTGTARTESGFPVSKGCYQILRFTAHKLTTPVESNRFRILMPPYGYSSVKLKGIVLHGQSLGPNYPADVRAGKPTTVIFDDNVADLSDAYANGFDLGYAAKSGPEAFSGGQYIVFDPAKNGGLNLMRADHPGDQPEAASY